MAVSSGRAVTVVEICVAVQLHCKRPAVSLIPSPFQNNRAPEIVVPQKKVDLDARRPIVGFASTRYFGMTVRYSIQAQVAEDEEVGRLGECGQKLKRRHCFLVSTSAIRARWLSDMKWAFDIRRSGDQRTEAGSTAHPSCTNPQRRNNSNT